MERDIKITITRIMEVYYKNQHRRNMIQIITKNILLTQI